MKALPTVRQLSFFIALSRRESFSKAAEDCLVSQSTLSAGVKELEAILGAPLVDRSIKGFALTPLGQDVLQRAQDVLNLVDGMTRLAQASKPMSGPFRLGVIPTIGPFLLPKAMPKIRKAFPDLELYLREDLTANLVERLNAGLLDAILIAFPYEAPGLEHEEVAQDNFLLAAAGDPPHTPVRLKDLEGTNLLLLEDGHCLRDHALSACRLQPRAAAGAFGATSLFTLAQMADSGLGVTLLPEIAIDAGLTRGLSLTVTPFAEPAPFRRIGVAWRAGSACRDSAKEIASVIREALPKPRRV